MTIRHLKIFITVADCGKMRQAATILHISQPSVSQAIREMEDYYNVKLFERLSQRIYITPVGKELLSYARHIISSFEQMEEHLSDSSMKNIIRIGCSVSVGAVLLPHFLQKLESELPQADIQVTVDNTTKIEQLIECGQLDMGIVEGMIENQEFIQRDITDDELVLVVGKPHPLYHKKNIQITELINQPFICREAGSVERNQFEKFLEEHDIPIKKQWNCSNIETIKNRIVDGKEVAILSEMLVRNEIKTKQFQVLTIENITINRKIRLIYHKNKYVTRPMEIFSRICMGESFHL